MSASPFQFTGQTISIARTLAGNKKNVLGNAGVFCVKAGQSVNPPAPPGETLLCLENYDDNYMTLSALQSRLDDGTCRKKDYDDIKGGTQRPFDLWDTDGTAANMPTNLVPTRKAYNDDVQLKRWIDVAMHLRKQPNINPMFARFSLKPASSLELIITPEKIPSLVDKNKLDTIVTANQAKFTELGWTNVKVEEYTIAEADTDLMIVGCNFLQLYFTWMKVDEYETLWKTFKTTELLHKLPAEGDVNIYATEDGKLKKGTGNAVVQYVTVTSLKLGNTEDRGNTGTIMGASATKVANEVWKNDPLHTKMGGNIKAEWLHRASHALGGADSVNNLVFGSWECNTDMIRAENMVTALTKKDKAMPASGYQGMLTTVNYDVAGKIYCKGLEKAATVATIPTWVATKQYSWLCFRLDYQYQMTVAPPFLGHPVVWKTTFDPWSLYVPLNVEPRLDKWILDDLR